MSLEDSIKSVSLHLLLNVGFIFSTPLYCVYTINLFGSFCAYCFQRIITNFSRFVYLKLVSLEIAGEWDDIFMWKLPYLTLVLSQQLIISVHAWDW